MRTNPVPAETRGATLLLPTRALSGALPPAIAATLGRADVLAVAEAGRDAQLRRYFSVRPAPWSVAALTRQCDAGDAAGAAWLRADPAHVRPDINGVRLMGVGERLSLSAGDVDTLLPALKPLFGDAGFALDAPTPSRWYLRLARETALPAFSAPDAALGEDLFEHQPQGAEARRWRALLNETQVVLHNHPWNAQRRERGLVPVNALWLWGGGALPDQTCCDVRVLYSDDPLTRALAAHADRTAQGLPDTFSSAPREPTVLFDLHELRDPERLRRGWLEPAIRMLRDGGIDRLLLDTVDGTRLVLTRGQRWRFWRRPWAASPAAPA